MLLLLFNQLLSDSIVYGRLFYNNELRIVLAVGDVNMF
jgi:hypothetical protein